MRALVTSAVVFAIMAVELFVSRRNEGRLRTRGAREPAGDVYAWMRFIYPSCFAAMALEGWLREGPGRLATAGLLVFAASKVLKTWAILSLGPRWSFRVLVQPGEGLVASGPYRYLRHPNYLAIFGELAGVALYLDARVAGLISLAVFAWLLRTRIAVEERALGLRA